MSKFLKALLLGFLFVFVSALNTNAAANPTAIFQLSAPDGTKLDFINPSSRSCTVSGGSIVIPFENYQYSGGLYVRVYVTVSQECTFSVFYKNCEYYSKELTSGYNYVDFYLPMSSYKNINVPISISY